MRTDGGRGVWLTLIVTNLIKLGGLGIAGYEIFVVPSPKPVVIVLSAFMMAGAQGVEDAAIRFVERFFGMPPKPPETVEDAPDGKV